MPDTTPNLALPFILPSQAQKHVTHNEALQQLDAVVQLVVAGSSTAPSADPAEGECWIFDGSTWISPLQDDAIRRV